jgi:hypothetical protein
MCYDDSYDTVYDTLTLCVTENSEPAVGVSSDSGSSSSSSDDPVSASTVMETQDAALKLDSELSQVPGDVNDLASTSRALNSNLSAKSDSGNDGSVNVIDTSLLNFITTMYDDARICIDNYDLLSTRFSKRLDISSSFEHLSNKSKGFFLNSVSSSITYG